MSTRDKEKHREYVRQYRLKNIEKVKEQQKKYREKRLSTLEGRNKRIEAQKEWTRLNPHKVMLYASRIRARNKGMENNIELSDIIIPEYCPYIGIELVSKGGPCDSSPSLDRIDNSRGYIKGNVQIISSKANKMKNNGSEEELIAFAKGVLKIHAGIDVDKIIAQVEQLQ